MLFLDFLLLIMITVCIAYCWILNRRIQDLQNSRIEFARMIKELNASILKAEHNVQEMSELSKVTSKEIKEVVQEAREISAELISIGDFATDVSKKLEMQVKDLHNGVINEEAESYIANLSSKAGEKFTDEDLPEVEVEESKQNYTNHLKNFIQKVVTKKTDANANANLNQLGYYNTLRKINLKNR